MPDDVRSPRTTVLLAAGAAAVFALLWALRASLGPFWIVAAAAALLWPVRHETAARAVMWAGGLVFGAYLLDRLAGVLAPFIAVFVAAYLLNPVVGWAERRRVPRAAAALALALVVTGAVVGALVLLVPAALGQLETLAEQAVDLAMRAPEWVAESAALARAEEAGLLDRDAVAAQITTLVPGQIEGALARIPALVGGALRQVGALLGLVTTAALVPVLLFFTLKDFPTLSASLVRLLPRYDGRRTYLDRAATVFGSYVRGVLVISAASAVLVAVPLTLFGVPYALLLGLAAGLLNLIPSLGSVLTYVLGVALMLAFGTWTDLLIVLAVLAVQAVIEQAVLTPNIMSAQVGLHPVVILLALFVAGALFGLLGLVLAVPGAALVAGVVRAHREALVIDLGDDDETPEVAAA
ncbi:AI-2E family transporter [Rubrivirga sp. IMCC43871]|uniref:AI-2E family transporter n=1 Tax=Rubrivirga sp. IMCC43871 TaxID=3391575 RepID=UPI00398FD136